ncbi:MAG: hypothetical protein ACRD1H_02160, partial [Vicinamibacterales bacterium]
MFCLSGCSGCEDGAGGGPASQPFQGETVTVAAPRSLGLESSWQLLLAEWSEQTGAEHAITEYELDGGEHSLNRTMARSVDGRSPTLIVFPLTRLPELAFDGSLAEMSPEQRERLNWLEVFKGLRENIVRSEGRAVAVPVSAPVLVCYYRQDLLDSAGLVPPETWGDYQDLLATLDRWAPGLTAVEPWGEEFRATLFLARATAFARHPGNYSFYFDITTGDPLIDSPGFTRALEAAAAAREHLADEVVRYAPADCRREILSGRAALALAFETGPGNPPLAFGPAAPSAEVSASSTASETETPPEDFAIGFCRLPGSPQVYNHSAQDWDELPDDSVNRAALTGFGGVAVGVSARTTPESAAAAWNLVETLTVFRLNDAFPEGAKTPCRDSHLLLSADWV